MKSKNLTLASLFAGLFMFMNPMGSEACTIGVFTTDYYSIFYR